MTTNEDVEQLAGDTSSSFHRRMLINLRHIWIVLLLAGYVCTGCASMQNRFHTCKTNDWACCVSPIRVPHYVYPGTQSDLRDLAIPFWSSGDAMYDGLTCMTYPVPLIDLPLSFVTDTIFLPYDIYMITAGGRTRYRKDIRQNSQPKADCREEAEPSPQP